MAKQQTKFIGVHLPIDDAKDLRKIAFNEDSSSSAVAREFVEDGIARARRRNFMTTKTKSK